MILQDISLCSANALPFYEPRRIIFYGAGRQAANLVLCIRKQLDRDGVPGDVQFVGLGLEDRALTAFAAHVRGLFPHSGEPELYPPDAVLERQDEAAVGFVASPPQTHKQGVQWMLRHGVQRVVIEKPIAASHADLEEIAALMRTRPHAFGVQEQYLYSRLFGLLLHLVIDPGTFISRYCAIPVRRRLTVLGTTTCFAKNRVQDLLAGRHVENICLLELPHVVTVLHNLFGRLTIDDARISDLTVEGRLFRSYREADVVVVDGEGRRHGIRLSNVERFSRVMEVEVSDGYRVTFSFPGRLNNRATVFESRMAVRRNEELLYDSPFHDDHLTEAVRSYLEWRNILGTLKTCYEPSRLVLDICEAAG